MRTDRDVVFHLWCRLTGRQPLEVGPDERAAFDSRPQPAQLSAVPYPTLLDAGITSASRGSLRWNAGSRRSDHCNQPAAGTATFFHDQTSRGYSGATDSSRSWPGLDR